MGTEQDPDDAPASQKDILLAAKAMYHRFQEVVDARVKEAEQGLSFRLGKLLEVEVEKRVGAMQGGILDYLGKTLVDDTARRLKDLEGRMEVGMKSLERSQEESVKGLWGECVKEIGRVRDTLDNDVRWMNSLVGTINSLPVPQVSVTVPDHAIQINQVPSHVTIPENAIQVHQMPSQVTIPENAIHVEVNQLPSQVSISDKAFHLTVDQPAAQVQVNVPQARLVKKAISYDDYGRPTQIEEQEM